jgi:hypothetical protein
VQLLCAAAGLGLGLLLPRITTEASVASTRVTETLVAVGFGVLGLVSIIIFSLLFLVVQWAFGSLSPRLNLFRDDPSCCKMAWRRGQVTVRVSGGSCGAGCVSLVRQVGEMRYSEGWGSVPATRSVRTHDVGQLVAAVEQGFAGRVRSQAEREAGGGCG